MQRDFSLLFPPFACATNNLHTSSRTAVGALTIGEPPGVLALVFGCFMPNTVAGTQRVLTSCLLAACLSSPSSGPGAAGPGDRDPVEVARALPSGCPASLPPEASGVQSPRISPTPRRPPPPHDSTPKVVPEMRHLGEQTYTESCLQGTARPDAHVRCACSAQASVRSPPAQSSETLSGVSTHDRAVFFSFAISLHSQTGWCPLCQLAGSTSVGSTLFLPGGVRLFPTCSVVVNAQDTM